MPDTATATAPVAEEYRNALTYAQAPTITRELLDQLSDHDVAEVRAAVAFNPSTSEDTRIRLARDSDGTVRSAAVRSGLLETDIVYSLAADGYLGVRVDVARVAEGEILEMLAVDPAPVVREAAAGNKGLSIETLKSLADDSEPLVRLAVHYAAQERQLRITVDVEIDPLTGGLPGQFDFDDDITEARAAHEAIQAAGIDEAGALASADPMDRVKLARHEDCSEASLTTMASDSEEFIRSTVANAAKCPVSVLANLASDESKWVRASVAGNDNTDAAVVAGLSSDDEPVVREAAASHTGLSSEIIDALAGDSEAVVRARVATRQDLDDALFTTLSVDKEDVVRATLAGHAPSDSPVLKALATDSQVAVRRALCGRDTLEDDVILALSADVSPTVRYHVAANFDRPSARFDAMPVADLIRWHISAWRLRLRELIDSNDAVEEVAMSLVGDYTGTVAELAAVARMCA